MRVVARKQGRAAPLSRVSQIAKLAHGVVAQLLASGRADGEASMSVLARLDLRRAGGRSERPLLPLSRCCSPCAPTRRPNLSEESGMLLRCRFDASSQTSALRDQSAMPGRCASAWYGGPRWPEIKAVVFRLGYGRRLGPRIGIDLRRRRPRALEQPAGPCPEGRSRVLSRQTGRRGWRRTR